VLTDKAQPLTRSDEITGTVLMYKEGQSFLMYMAEHYGNDKVFDLLDNWYRAEDFETAFRIVYGLPLAEADEAWFGAMRRRYYPAVATTSRASDVAKRFTMDGRFNLGPRVLPARDAADTTVRFCHFAAGEAGVDLMLNEPAGRGRRDRRLLRGGQSPSFESFHLFRSRPDASAGHDRPVLARRARSTWDSRGRCSGTWISGWSRSTTRPVPGDSAVVFSAQDSAAGPISTGRAGRNHVRPSATDDD
jgi:hypothetical protein